MPCTSQTMAMFAFADLLHCLVQESKDPITGGRLPRHAIESVGVVGWFDPSSTDGTGSRLERCEVPCPALQVATQLGHYLAEFLSMHHRVQEFVSQRDFQMYGR